MGKKRRAKKREKVEQEAEQTDLLSDEEASPEPIEDAGSGPTEDVAPAPTEDATPAPTEDATPAPTEDATPAPTEDATPAPTEDAAPVPTPDATPESTKDATSVPTEDATPVPTEAPSQPVSGEARTPVSFELVPEEGVVVPVPPAGEQLGRAKDLVRDGRIAEAIVLYRDILVQNPANLKARNNLGVLYDELGNMDLALEQFEAAELIEPDNVELLNNYGSVLGAMGHYDEAAQLFRRAQRLDPEGVAARASIGILHYRRGVYASAEADLAWVCEQDDTHGPAFYYRGEALNRLGRFDEALQALEHASVLQPQNAKVFYTLGHLYDRKHLGEEAALMYRKARELSRE